MEKLLVEDHKRHMSNDADISTDQTILQAADRPPVAGPSSAPTQTSSKRNYNKKQKVASKLSGLNGTDGS